MADVQDIIERLQEAVEAPTRRADTPAWSRPGVLAGMGMFLLLVVLCFGRPLWTSYDPNATGDLLLDRFLPPSPEHPFGTDKFGRDVLARVLDGGRLSLGIALASVAVALLIGVLYGTVAGYMGGRLDAVMMRVLDFVLAFPILFLLLALVALFQPDHRMLIPFFGLTGWMETARLVRGQVLSVKEQEFVQAARVLRFSTWHILRHHIWPASLGPVLATLPFRVSDFILLESALSFLGLGVQPPHASWGSLISDGRAQLFAAWWLSAFPGLFILITVISLNLIGESLRKHLQGVST